MIVAERKPVTASYMLHSVPREQSERFGEMMEDGRLTEPSGSKCYRLREAIIYSRRLGRPLTEQEMVEFEV